jgi:hypothetical protein
MTQSYDCDNGWIQLIDEAKNIITKYNENHLDQTPLEFIQIKEKWGGLCLYLNYYVPEISDKIHEIEHKSFSICEHCGTNKQVKTEWTHGWVMTLCDKCRKLYIDKYESLDE